MKPRRLRRHSGGLLAADSPQREFQGRLAGPLGVELALERLVGGAVGLDLVMPQRKRRREASASAADADDAAVAVAGDGRAWPFPCPRGRRL